MLAEALRDMAEYARAEGYAWGRQDAAHDALPTEDFEGRVAATDTDKSAKFAEAFAQHRLAFRESRIGMAYNLRSAYEKWLRGETLPTGTPVLSVDEMIAHRFTTED